jgi:hypothetical protein
MARVETDTLQLHRLLATLLRPRTRSVPTQGLFGSLRRRLSKADTATRAVRLLHAAVPDDPWNNQATWPVWQQLLPHVLAAAVPGHVPDTAHEDIAYLITRADGLSDDPVDGSCPATARASADSAPGYAGG